MASEKPLSIDGLGRQRDEARAECERLRNADRAAEERSDG